MINKKGLLLVLSGPSGAGKGSICKRYLEKNSVHTTLSVSATTRSPREGEVEGISYFFKEKEVFEKMIENGEFLEYAKVYDNYYGTPCQAIVDNIEKGIDVILEIEMQGAIQVKAKYPSAVCIFVLPPSLDELKNRIVGRGTETLEQIEKRFNSAFEEIEMLGNYDYFIFNCEIDKSVEMIEKILCTERHKVIRYKDDVLNMFKKEKENVKTITK